MKLTQSSQWKALQQHYETQMKSVHLRQLFKDEKRFEKFSINDEKLGILFDYSKNIIDEKTIQLLLDLVKVSNVDDWKNKEFSGEKINWTEKRAVLHTALRNMSNNPVYVDGKDVMPEIKAVLEKMKKFT